MGFRSNLKFDKNSDCFDLKCHQLITMKFCTHHDSVTVVMCAKFPCDKPNIYYELALHNFIGFQIQPKYPQWEGRLSAARASAEYHCVNKYQTVYVYPYIHMLVHIYIHNISLTIFFIGIKIQEEFQFILIQIQMKFCSLHDSSAVVACEKIYCNLMTMNWLTAKLTFPSNLNCK